MNSSDSLLNEEQYLHYANLIESSDSAIYSRDTKGKILTWNKAAESLFGYTAGEIVGKNVSVLLPPERQDKVSIINKKLKSDENVSDFELDIITKKGKRLPITAKISPIKDPQGKLIGAAIFARDNTLKKKDARDESFIADATKLLASSFNYDVTLKNLAKLLVPGLADWSAIHIIERGRLVRLTVNHVDPNMVKTALELQQKYGFKNNNKGVTQVIKTGKSILYPYVSQELIEKTTKDKNQRELINFLKLKSVIIAPIITRKKVLGAMTLVSSDENRLYDKRDLKLVEDLGRRAGSEIEHARLFYEAKKELVKRKRAEKELRQSRDELEVILKSIADGITVQSPKGDLTYANEAAAASSGYSSKLDMMKDPVAWIKLFDLEDEAGHPMDLRDLPGREAIQTKNEVRKVIGFTNKQTGERRWALIKARPILENGEVKAVVNVINDITDRQELERRKDDFISIASHELKTPLTSIKGYVYLLKSVVKKDKASWEMLDRIESQVSRLSLLVQDLLDLSQMKDGKLTYQKEEIELPALLAEVVSDMQQTSSKHKIIYKDGVRAKVVGDKDRLSQVIINLLTNAMKYSPQSDNIHVTIERTDKNAKISVQDHGIGIQKDEQDKIFERFYRVKDTKDKTFPGHGIGLFFSKEVVERHKGKIWVESKKGVGSTFYVTLPVKS